MPIEFMLLLIASDQGPMCVSVETHPLLIAWPSSDFLGWVLGRGHGRGGERQFDLNVHSLRPTGMRSCPLVPLIVKMSSGA